ncbi:MAG: P-type conjugative transfer protein TrbG [Sedimenticola sp.]|uniref:P-type conjugative transfer protein TrbG n=2 Tax=Sedimenticola TaxID=349742 RepID=A0A558CLQ0_9GAMM|nr:P-type conjugative transfer protein TrbG [Sedimenticola selenatireducens]PLY12874.1 MAG: P-type conjugative transfer protein TrbG [Sedimenticola sp.]TVO69683.1 P-type conjugative transfer protein TrbG [Sedimenticola selenatireducens]TVT49686.1 MAG: P-type conjugative transfer protein TrbG [Sedimenticola thiotaurini]TVT62249.1 MAG: P-type conjugative transfer protein TrbG [Sedimenticola selenatireducens]
MKRTFALAALMALACTVSGTSLEPKDKEALKLAAAWMKHPITPKKADNGTVIFPYGESLPTIVCAPLRLCDIALQPGETVKHVRLGDTVRWKISPASSGPEIAPTTHAIVKPLEANLETTLLITTDRRTYHLRLVSDKKSWMPQVAFEYPEDQERAWAQYAVQQKELEQKEKLETMPQIGMHIEDLNFKYTIEGDSHWRPVRVFDDGTHTYIDLPRESKFRDAPILLVKDGKQDRLVNYRMHGERFVVDSLFDEAVLISGVGSEQQKITIKRTEG